MTVEGQTCVVTGASRGIGRGIAKDLASHGAEVVVNYRSSQAEADAVVEGIEERGGEAIPVQADVTDREAIDEMQERVAEAYDGADVLINNAGITADSKFENMSRAEWDRVMEVNLGGVYNCTKAFYDDIREAEDGRLINISSVVGQQGNYGQSNYAATKSGLFGMTRTLALEMAQSGSTANCVAPGFVATDMMESIPERVKQKILREIPLDRFATIEDVASLVRFVAGTESSYMTGQVLSVNGGMEC